MNQENRCFTKKKLDEFECGYLKIQGFEGKIQIFKIETSRPEILRKLKLKI